MAKLLRKVIGPSAPASNMPWQTRRSDLFSAMREDERQAIERLAQVHALRRDHSLFLSSDLGGAVCLLKSGRLKITRLSRDGREFILDIVEAGELFGSLSAPEEPVPETMAEAFEDSLLLAIPRIEFEGFLRSRPDLALAVAKSIDQRHRSIEGRIEDLVFLDIPGRLANALLRLADLDGMATDGGIAVGFRITQQELANLIGASREMVNHTLSHWKRAGLIEPNGRSIVIRQPEALKSLASAR